MTRRQGVFYAYLSLAFVMLFWAGNSIVARAVRADIPPFTLAFLRWAIGIAILAPLTWNQLRRDAAALVRGWKPLLALGITGVAGFNGFLYLGLHYTSAANALLLQAAVPAGVLLADRLIFRLSAPIGRVAGVAFSTIGVVLIVLQADASMLAGLHLGLGDLLILGSVVSWSLYTSILRIKPPVHALSLLASTFLIGALCMMPLAAMEWTAGERPRAEPDLIAAVLYVAIFPSLISYLLFNRAVDTIGGAKAGQTISLMPLFGALLAALVLGEELHLYHLLGMLLIMGGIGLTVFLENKRGADTKAGTS